jgi:2-polyprenyl-3-methyl-5-hydroxy-6-metoxy-1,4-benzoquinol methylase
MPKNAAPRQPTNLRAADVAHETLRTFSLTHNYNLWVMGMISPHVGRKTLEVGCGIGNLTYYLQDLSELVCIDISDLYLAHMRIDFPDIKLLKCDLGSDALRELKPERFDTVVCVNVLEHIEDDRHALAVLFEILEPGGRLLLHVPALSALYGTLDRNLDHYRRYSRKGLLSFLNETGFEVEQLNYCNLLATLGWFWNSRILRKSALENWPTILFDKLVPLIAAVERRLKPPFGMSLFAVARKPERS